TVRDAAAYVQMRPKKYITRFLKQSKTGKKIGWNWSALILSPFWFFYRKIYKAGALFLGLTLVLITAASIPASYVATDMKNIVDEYVKITSDMTNAQMMEVFNSVPADKMTELTRYAAELMGIFALAMLIPNIFAALTADMFYRKKVVRDVKALREFAQNDHTFGVMLLRRGGVSFFAAVGCLIIFNLFTQLILYL
ncbi:MAG: DUF2628 domain-containing protein, partial [Clostridiales bacterium]|nr:DUF2628 domain-containing protein [Clostridiales bacterium]